MTGEPTADDNLRDIVDANAEYLNPFMSENGFRELASSLYFDDYLDEEGNPIVSSKGFYHWIKDVSAGEYLTEANRYIDFVNSIIQRRGEKMLEALKGYMG